MTTTISVGTQQTSIYNALVPPEGPKSVLISLDFTVTSSYLIDFTQAYMSTSISLVQSVYVDNSQNPDPLSITVAGTQQQITAAPGSQGTYPVIAAIRPKITCQSSGGVLVNLIFLNVPLPAATWQPHPISGPTAAATFTVAAGGTPVVVFPARSIINGAVITNPYSASESLFVDPVNLAGTTAPGTAGTTTELKAGDSFGVPGGSASDVSVNAATTGHVFTAWSY